MKTIWIGMISIVLLTAVGYSQDESVHQPAGQVAGEAPDWLKDYQFGQQTLTFVRVKYTSAFKTRPSHDWATDHPDADEKIASFIQSKTSLATDHKVLELTSSDLLNHKLIYIVEPGLMRLANSEVEALQQYLKNGGMVVLDDSFGDIQYEHIRSELKRVFPSKELTDLPMDHAIFHCVFNFTEKPQVPSENVDDIPFWKSRVGSATYQCITDENGRVLVVVCHNTDLGDGWACLGDDTPYARDYADGCAGPFGVNLIFYALTRGRAIQHTP